MTSLNEILAARRADWVELEGLLDRLEAGRRLAEDEVERVCRLYRAVSSDLVRIRTASGTPAILDYLNHLVGRGYGAVHRGRRFRLARLGPFLAVGLPRRVRAEGRAVGVAAACLAAGIVCGAVAIGVDAAGATEFLVPELYQSMSPEEHIAAVTDRPEDATLEGTGFASTFYFGHNVQVAAIAFAAGLLLGIPTDAILFANGLLVGALLARYWVAGPEARLFFLGWILPHGIPELTAVVLAGAGGMVLGAAVARPGRWTVGESLRRRGRAAAELALGALPLFAVAAVVEAAVSQTYEPHLGDRTKIAFAAVLAGAIAAWLTPFLRTGARSKRRPVSLLLVLLLYD